VLRRPDVFHAAIAGAPVTDWRLYDTHYTERYLGDPDQDRDAYRQSGLISLAERSVVTPAADAIAPRPLMLIHGLADDNVVVAHTLRLSAALLAVGYPHTVLPLSGITHMASQETVAENLLLLQLDFLRRALDIRRISRQPIRPKVSLLPLAEKARRTHLDNDVYSRKRGRRQSQDNLRFGALPRQPSRLLG
jgi:Prolyl oligopeptidase family